MFLSSSHLENEQNPNETVYFQNKILKKDNLDWIGFVQIEKNSANNWLFPVSKNCFLLQYPEVQLMRIDVFREKYKNNTVW